MERYLKDSYYCSILRHVTNLANIIHNGISIDTYYLHVLYMLQIMHIYAIFCRLFNE